MCTNGVFFYFRLVDKMIMVSNSFFLGISTFVDFDIMISSKNEVVTKSENKNVRDQFVRMNRIARKKYYSFHFYLRYYLVKLIFLYSYIVFVRWPKSLHCDLFSPPPYILIIPSIDMTQHRFIGINNNFLVHNFITSTNFLMHTLSDSQIQGTRV